MEGKVVNMSVFLYYACGMLKVDLGFSALFREIVNAGMDRKRLDSILL
jgi:hypothetical protein